MEYFFLWKSDNEYMLKEIRNIRYYFKRESCIRLSITQYVYINSVVLVDTW